MLLGILAIVAGCIIALLVAICIIWLASVILPDELVPLSLPVAVLVFVVLCRGSFLLGGSLY